MDSRLKKLAKKKKYDELESAWMAAVEENVISVKEFIPAIQVLVCKGEIKRAESLFSFLVDACAEHSGPRAGVDAASEGAAVLAESKVLRDEVAALYEKMCDMCPEVEQLTKVTVRKLDVPLDVGIRRMDKLLAFVAGAYVMDEKFGKPGRVERFNADNATLLVRFKDAEEECGIPALDDMKSLEDDDFRALVIFEQDRLGTLAKEDPVALVTMALKASKSRLSYKDLKSHLAGVITASSWSKWWSGAKRQLVRCGTIEVTEGSQPVLILQDSVVAYEDRLLDRFSRCDSLEAKLVMVLECLKEVEGKTPAEENMFRSMAGELMQYWDPSPPHPTSPQRGEGKGVEGSNTEPALLLGVLAVVSLINERLSESITVPEISLESIVSGESGLLNSLFSIEMESLTKAIFSYVRGAMPDKWRGIWAEIMPGCSKGICEWVAKGLSETGNDACLETAAAAILNGEEKHSSALVWLWGAVCTNKFSDTLGSVDRAAIAARLLLLVERLPRTDVSKETRKRLLAEVRSAIIAKDYALMRDVLKEVDVEQAAYIRNIVERNIGLTENMQSQLLSVIAQTHPSLSAEELPPWKDGSVYTTREGLGRRQEEFAKLVNVKMPKVAKAIGNAAEFGDLSENAEFTAALEERDRLVKRMSTMKDELDKAKIIPSRKTQTDNVTVGSTVKAKDSSSGALKTFTFLGPWDADHEKGIFSYRAPFALAFMGKKVGEAIPEPSGNVERVWEIVDIS